jgi:hypothetical protein
MQLNHAAARVADIDSSASDSGAEVPPSKAMREYETRRCHVCQGRCPPFGFGPPLTRPDQTIWACVTQWADIDRPVDPKAGDHGRTRTTDLALAESNDGNRSIAAATITRVPRFAATRRRV